MRITRDQSKNIGQIEEYIINSASSVLRVAWQRDIVSSQGAQYHVWVPRGLSKKKEQQIKTEFERCAKYTGDVVYLSYDYVPKSIRQAKCDYCENREIKRSNLALLKERPADEEDRYYCGCRGWE